MTVTPRREANAPSIKATWESEDLMARAERLAALLEELVADGRIDVDASAVRHQVSAATIRRDLDYLADQQLLNLAHGGAVPNTVSYDLPLRYKAASRGAAKKRIARRATEMLLARLHSRAERRHHDDRDRASDPRGQRLE
ncbi:MAG TPA: DeoR family transcriptional regulator [Propionibacteriaceae bacterium]|nr:DeoR family transcriptional regulator [Propionibacteriaceae bacterium]